MDVRQFLEAVLPWDVEGSCSLHWHEGPGKPFHSRSFTTLDELLSFLHSSIPNGYHIYFALARHTGQRSRSNAIALKVIPLDVDVDETGQDPNKYHSLEEAITAVFRFCKSLSIPNPSIMVGSGGGLHCYWISDRSLLVLEWEVYAKAFKATAQKAKLKCDYGVTADAARVLRPPGTKNFKFDPPRVVRVIGWASFGTTYDFGSIFTFAGVGFGTVGVNVSPGPIFEQVEETNANQPKTGPGKIFESADPAADFSDLPVEDLGEGLGELPLLPFEPIKAGCEWLRVAHETGGKEYSNFFWNQTTLCATWLENGHDLTHEMANQHPGYVYGQTEKLWERKHRERNASNIGWPKCSTIKSNGCRACDSCEHGKRFNWEKSPLHLGLAAVHQAANEEEVKQTPFAETLHLPPPYTTDENGLICAIVPGKRVKVGGGWVYPMVRMQLLQTKIMNPIPQLNGTAAPGLKFTRFDKWGKSYEVTLEAGDVANNFPKILGKNGVWIVNSDTERKWIDRLGPSWMTRLGDEIKALEAPTMGWRYHEGSRVGFCYANKFFHCDGREDDNRIPRDDNLFSFYAPAGQPEPWLKACKLLTDRKRPELDIILSVPFAAPLTTFLGNFYGGILSVWGEPGTAKSTAQQVGAAVWGHPKQTRESLDSTKKSVTNRLGRTRNFPAYWDDVQSEDKQEHLFHTMFMTAQGIEGGRLTSDVQARARGEWQTMMVACSNASFVEYVIKKQPSTTAGLRRVLEIEYKKRDDQGMIDEYDALQVFGEIERHYGHVGMQYAKLLATEHDQIKALVEQTTKRFKGAVQGKADEGYWWGIASTLIVGATLSNRLGAGMNAVRMEEFLQGAFKKNREIRSDEGTEGGSQKNTDAALAQFLNVHAGSGHAIWTDVASRSRYQHLTPIQDPGRDRPVYIHVIVDERLVRFSKKMFRKYLSDQNIKTRQVFDGLKQYYLAKEKETALAGGTAFAGVKEDVIEIPVPRKSEGEEPHPLEALLTAHRESKCDDWQGGGDDE